MVVTLRPATVDSGVTQERIGLAVQMNRARAAERHAAAELGSGQAGDLADGPQQGHVRVGIQGGGLAVEYE